MFDLLSQPGRSCTLVFCYANDLGQLDGAEEADVPDYTIEDLLTVGKRQGGVSAHLHTILYRQCLRDTV